ncbi:MAG: hypothetical protein AAF215_28215 [Cyanobacteria bacterium P01_A01_bin.123]
MLLQHLADNTDQSLSFPLRQVLPQALYWVGKRGGSGRSGMVGLPLQTVDLP